MFRTIKLYLLTFSLITFSIFTVDGQTPGGIGKTNLTAWFSTDNVETGELDFWSSLYPLGVNEIILNEVSTPYPTVKNTGLENINYHAVIDFTGNTTESLMAFENPGPFNLLDNNTEGSTGSFFAVYYLLPNYSCSGCHVVNYREGTSGNVDGIQFRVKLGDNGRIAIGSGNSSFGSKDWTQDFIPDIVSYRGNKSKEGSMQAFERSLIMEDIVASATTGTEGLYIGTRRFGSNENNAVFDGYVSEILFFNKDLDDEEMLKMHSYLALKYGITLDNIGGETQGDYISSEGELIWDASENALNHFNVIGIGRDDDYGFLQKQSRTNLDSTRIYLESLKSSNNSNMSIIPDDYSFLMLGDNHGKMDSLSGSNSEMPGNNDLVFRLDREWKVSNRNFERTFNMDFQLEENVDLSNQNSAKIRLLVHENQDMSEASVYSSEDNLEFIINQNTLTVIGINKEIIPVGSDRYLTIAYTDVETSNLAIQSNTLKIYPNPTAQNLVVDADNISLEDLNIYDFIGNELTGQLSFQRITNSKIHVDCSNLAPGMYLIKSKAKSLFFFVE